jgi:hypothetical protein
LLSFWKENVFLATTSPSASLSPVIIARNAQHHLRCQSYQSQALNTPVVIGVTLDEGALFVHSCDGNLAELKELLKTPAMITVVNKCRDVEMDLSIRGRSNLYLMLLLAARAGQAAIVELLFAFEREHSDSVDRLVDRDLVLAAIDSNDIEVFQKIVDVVPASVNQNLGMAGDPLNQAVWRTTWGLSTPQQAIDLTSFLLKNGADPNGTGGNAGGGSGCPSDRPLTDACHSAPLELIELLIQHGAQIPQSGALQKAIIEERLDVLDLLLKSGADVNERLSFTVNESYWLDEETKKERCSETPLHLAVRHMALRSASWLLKNGADTTIQNTRGLTALDFARESSDKAVVEIFTLPF